VSARSYISFTTYFTCTLHVRVMRRGIDGTTNGTIGESLSLSGTCE
jgi:hypothetical protein